MYALKRMAAFGIDYAVVFVPLGAFIEFFMSSGPERIPGPFGQMAGIWLWGASLLAPAIVNGVLTGLFGCGLGKLVMFLRVKDSGGDPPGIAQGILREIVKVISMSFFFLGPIYALQGLVARGRTFYDDWMDLDVEDLRPHGLTETQKNYRKYMREQARKARR